MMPVMENARAVPVPRWSPTSDAESTVARLLIGGSFVFAIIGQTLLFHTAPLMGGDARYHRGVALTMSAGNFQGEGPIHGLITYFGGRYGRPMAFGLMSGPELRMLSRRCFGRSVR